jgi:hypothetical protein
MSTCHPLTELDLITDSALLEALDAEREAYACAVECDDPDPVSGDEYDDADQTEDPADFPAAWTGR